MGLPIFTGAEETEEIIADLRQYLAERGATLNEPTQGDDYISELLELMGALSAAFRAGDAPDDAERMLNCIVSIVLLHPEQLREQLVAAFARALTAAAEEADAFSSPKLKALNNLFHGLEETSKQRATVYLAMVELAGDAGQLTTLQPRLAQIKAWMAVWQVPVSGYQTLLRALYKGLAAAGPQHQQAAGIKAADVMLELLSSFTAETAAEARQDAERCIVSTLADPASFVMDHLLRLKPVKALEGELIHQLLTIFISGRLAQYTAFHGQHADLVEGAWGLSHEACLDKMRILTLMSIAEQHTELTFAQLRREMHIEEEQVESFIIDVVRTRMVQARIDHVDGKVLLQSTTQRCFDKPQWLELRSRLISWQQNLGGVLQSLESLIQFQQTSAAQQGAQQAAVES